MNLTAPCLPGARGPSGPDSVGGRAPRPHSPGNRITGDPWASMEWTLAPEGAATQVYLLSADSRGQLDCRLRAVLRGLLPEDVAERDLGITHRPDGRPALADPVLRSELDVSFADVRGAAICALRITRTGRVGVDLERPKRIGHQHVRFISSRRHADAAIKLLTPVWGAWANAALWSAKEAAFKALSQPGLVVRPQDVEVRFRTPWLFECSGPGRGAGACWEWGACVVALALTEVPVRHLLRVRPAPATEPMFRPLPDGSA